MVIFPIEILRNVVEEWKLYSNLSFTEKEELQALRKFVHTENPYNTRSIVFDYYETEYENIWQIIVYFCEKFDLTIPSTPLIHRGYNYRDRIRQFTRDLKRFAPHLKTKIVKKSFQVAAKNLDNVIRTDEEDVFPYVQRFALAMQDYKYLNKKKIVNVISYLYGVAFSYRRYDIVKCFSNLPHTGAGLQQLCRSTLKKSMAFELINYFCLFAIMLSNDDLCMAVRKFELESFWYLLEKVNIKSKGQFNFVYSSYLKALVQDGGKQKLVYFLEKVFQKIEDKHSCAVKAFYASDDKAQILHMYGVFLHLEKYPYAKPNKEYLVRTQNNAVFLLALYCLNKKNICLFF